MKQKHLHTRNESLLELKKLNQNMTNPENNKPVNNNKNKAEKKSVEEVNVHDEKQNESEYFNMQKEKSNPNKNVENKGDDVYELDSEDNGDVDKNDDDKVNDDAGKNDKGDHDSNNADENEEDNHESDDADNNEGNSNGNKDEDDNQEDTNDSDEECWDHLNYQIHKKDDPGMHELKDGIYINRKIYDNAKKTKSTKPTHLIRRLMDGVFIQSEVLNCTLTGNPGRNKRQNEDECEMLHPLAVAAIISKATSLYKKARPNKKFISTKSIHETISQKLYEMKVKGSREKDENTTSDNFINNLKNYDYNIII